MVLFGWKGDATNDDCVSGFGAINIMKSAIAFFYDQVVFAYTTQAFGVFLRHNCYVLYEG